MGQSNSFHQFISFLSAKRHSHTGMKLFALLTASVFPEPVCAIPTISLPLMAIGQPWA